MGGAVGAMVRDGVSFLVGDRGVVLVTDGRLGRRRLLSAFVPSPPGVGLVELHEGVEILSLQVLDERVVEVVAARRPLEGIAAEP